METDAGHSVRRFTASVSWNLRPHGNLCNEDTKLGLLHQHRSPCASTVDVGFLLLSRYVGSSYAQSSTVQEDKSDSFVPLIVNPCLENPPGVGSRLIGSCAPQVFQISSGYEHEVGKSLRQNICTYVYISYSAFVQVRNGS